MNQRNQNIGTSSQHNAPVNSNPTVFPPFNAYQQQNIPKMYSSMAPPQTNYNFNESFEILRKKNLPYDELCRLVVTL